MSRSSHARQSYSFSQKLASAFMVASCTPCERSSTSSFDGSRVAPMRRRNSARSSSGTATSNGRTSVPVVVADIRTPLRCCTTSGQPVRARRTRPSDRVTLSARARPGQPPDDHGQGGRPLRRAWATARPWPSPRRVRRPRAPRRRPPRRPRSGRASRARAAPGPARRGASRSRSRSSITSSLGLVDDPPDLLVDQLLRSAARPGRARQQRAVLAAVGDGDRADRVAHSPAADHAAGDLGQVLDVRLRAGGRRRRRRPSRPRARRARP